MAYATSNPPRLLASAQDGSTAQLWSYASSDAISLVVASGYFTNAANLGMRVGDQILVSETDNGYAPVLLTVASISSGAATAGGASTLAVTAGAGITGGTGTVYKTGIHRDGEVIVTRILVDLTGLNSGGTAGDIIGTNGAGVAHLGQVTAARNGTIFGVRMTCLEAPAGGDTDIDLYSATEATGVEDVAITTLAETQILNSGVLSLGTTASGGDIAADQYLYLVGQGTANATYTAGRLLIELYGY